MHYGSCRKIESARLLFPHPIVPPALSFPSLQPSLRYTEARFINKISITFLDQEKC